MKWRGDNKRNVSVAAWRNRRHMKTMKQCGANQRRRENITQADGNQKM